MATFIVNQSIKNITSGNTTDNILEIGHYTSAAKLKVSINVVSGPIYFAIGKSAANVAPLVYTYDDNTADEWDIGTIPVSTPNNVGLFTSLAQLRADWPEDGLGDNVPAAGDFAIVDLGTSVPLAAAESVTFMVRNDVDEIHFMQTDSGDSFIITITEII